MALQKPPPLCTLTFTPPPKTSNLLPSTKGEAAEMTTTGALSSPSAAAELAVAAIGCGYDLVNDMRIAHCKARLVELDATQSRGLFVPGGVGDGGGFLVPDVPKAIMCDKGERTRFRSGVLKFHQMSELINQELSLPGTIPSGLFNAMFHYPGCWQKDSASTRGLAFDGWFISLYDIELAKTQIMLREQIKREIPSSWDSAALTGFIQKYGTHVIVGVKMGGKDVVHIKQQQNSVLQPIEVHNLLRKLSDDQFCETSHVFEFNDISRKIKNSFDKQLASLRQNPGYANSVRALTYHSTKEDIVVTHVRRGGNCFSENHNEWLTTIAQRPEAISMTLVPISSLLNGVQGSGFLSHAVNLYLRYKPPVQELHHFFEFQLPRQWASVYGDLPLGTHCRKCRFPALQFTFMGPKLFVNTDKADYNKRPATGIRLYLEGKRSDHLAVHLQHLLELPSILQISEASNYYPDKNPERDYYEPVKWGICSHVCTTPVQKSNTCIDESASIVTKAWLEVKDIGMKKVLFLRLGLSEVASAKIRRSEWHSPSGPPGKSGSISAFFSGKFSMGQALVEKPGKVVLNSAVFPGGPPMPSRMPKMLKFVDIQENVRGPEDLPGYWVVTGAKLCLKGGKISLEAKYSLLIIASEDDSF